MHGPYRVIRNAPFPLRRFDSGTTLTVSKDGGAFAAAGSAPVETPAASGIYFNQLSAIEMTADHVAYIGTAGDARSDGFLIPEPAFDSGVAQAGATTTITLRAAAPSFGLTGTIVEIVRGTGKDSTPRLITAYDTTTKIATVRPDWSTTPDNTSVYRVYQQDKVNVMTVDGLVFPAQALSEFWAAAYKTGTVASGSSTTVIKTNFTGYGANQIVGSVFFPLGVNNYGIMRKITAYNQTSGDITVYPAYAAVPALSDRFAVFGLTG